MSIQKALYVSDQILMAMEPTEDQLLLAANLRRNLLLEQQKSFDQVKETNERLPKIKPVKGKKLKSTDVSCPTCKAQPGRPCFRMTSRGPNGKPTKTVSDKKHVPRVRKAQEASS